MTEPLIQLESVRKVFYTDEVETHALDNVNIEIQRGEYVSIAGPSGCGKSTLLSILGLLDTPTDGRYVLNSRKATDGSRFLAVSRAIIGKRLTYKELIGAEMPALQTC